MFISADARGLFSYAFVDLGQNFIVNDPNGEMCKEVFIKYLIHLNFCNSQILLEHVNCETGEIFTLDNIYHELEDGDHIVFEEFEHVELNKLQPIPIKTTNS